MGGIGRCFDAFLVLNVKASWDWFSNSFRAHTAEVRVSAVLLRQSVRRCSFN